MTIANLWPELEADEYSLTRGEWVVRRLHPESLIDIRLGIGGRPSRRALLVTVEQSSLGRECELPKGRGFELVEALIAGCPRTHTTLAVTLTDQAYSEIFSTLLEDVVSHLLRAQTRACVAAELSTRLKVWQSFMEHSGPEGLTPEGQRGLYGELLFLKETMLRQLGPMRSLNAWVGPNGAQQDFQWQDRACEVKTTTSKQHQKIRIANELQLDGRSVKILWIYHLSLDAHRGAGNTLPDLIASVRSDLANDPIVAGMFALRLLEAGYHEVHAERYTDTGYSVRKATFYHVHDDFPCLTELDLPNGVGDVSYTISLAACEKFEVDASVVHSDIGG